MRSILALFFALILAACAAAPTVPDSVPDTDEAAASADEAAGDAAGDAQAAADEATADAMAEMEGHMPVEGFPHPIVYWEIVTADAPATRTFYGELFGWHLSPDPAVEGDYAMAHTVMAPDMGIPGGIGAFPTAPNYLTVYAWADDLRATLDAAVAAGATTIMEPEALPNGYGSVAMFADPEGRPFGLYSMEGFDPTSMDMEMEQHFTDHPVIHFEMASTNAAPVIEFYNTVFGWDMHEDAEHGYTGIMAGGGFGIDGGFAQLPPEMAEMPPYTTFYVGVPDLAASYATAQTLGAVGILEPTHIMEGVDIAMVQDPAGNMLGLILFTQETIEQWEAMEEAHDHATEVVEDPAGAVEGVTE